MACRLRNTTSPPPLPPPPLIRSLLDPVHLAPYPRLTLAHTLHPSPFPLHPSLFTLHPVFVVRMGRLLGYRRCIPRDGVTLGTTTIRQAINTILRPQHSTATATRNLDACISPSSNPHRIRRSTPQSRLYLPIRTLPRGPRLENEQVRRGRALAGLCGVRDGLPEVDSSLGGCADGSGGQVLT